MINDGDIVNWIFRVEGCYEKEYIVMVDCFVMLSFLKGMSMGVKIFGEMMLFCIVI